MRTAVTTGAKTPIAAANAGPVHYSADGHKRRRVSVRIWSVRHAAFLERLYHLFSGLLVGLEPLFRRIGYDRAEGPVALIEKGVKGFLFDCRMCGQCVLSSTGMSCPMNCPKQLRNGPCGGVRANGHCEVNADWPCVWVMAWIGSRNMAGGETILHVQPPVDQALRETSSWLRVVQASAAERETAR